MRSLPPADYATLPRLAPPAGYICVIRDVDSESYLIQDTDYPSDLVNDALAEAAGNFGIELLSILETDDLAVSECDLFEAHHAELSGEWLYLDGYQLQELRRSALRIDDHASQYLAANRALQSEAAVKDKNLAKAAVAPRGRRFGVYTRPPRRMKPGPAAYKEYGTRALRRERVREAVQTAEHEQPSWRESLSDRFNDLLHNRPGLVIGIMLLVMLLCLMYIWQNPYPYRY